MSLKITSAQNKVYNEDIVMAGETIIGGPCVIHDMTLSNDTATASIVIFSDSATYSSTDRCLKVNVPASTTVHLTFPAGKPMASGLSASSSHSNSVNVAVTYD
jgi:hypothetical protein